MANCTYTVPTSTQLAASGDSLYASRVCYQPFIDWAWDAYDFDKGDWDDGWGWDDCCNATKALARTFNAIWILAYSAQDYQNDSYSNDCLHWACRYTRECIDELDARCGDGPVARTQYGFLVDNWTQLYLPFFYNRAASERMSTLMHEARHADWVDHNSNFPSWSSYGAGKSGADSSWGYEGAWMYQALYLWWFAVNGQRTSKPLRDLAKNLGNIIIDNAFATNPGYEIVN